jgi:molybdate transport system substrate-binding protein
MKLTTHAPRALTAAALIFLLFPRSQAAEVRVFAAASLTDSLKELAMGYAKRSNDRIVFNFGASSTLARQIEEGAPADIFFSADEARMDALETKGLIDKSSRKSRLSNSLVIVVAAENGASVSSPQDLANPAIKRVSLGDPKAVPIGVYAKQYLQSLGIWPEVAPKIVATENVRAAMVAVEAGNADASIVYKTDAAISKKVRITFEVPPNQGPNISYPIALVKDAPAHEPARRVLEYLQSVEADAVFARYGFITAEVVRR